jgi:metal-sulfur cluster biosynthetic enzyme
VAKVEGTGLVTVQLVFEPSWTPDRMSDEARLALDMF